MLRKCKNYLNKKIISKNVKIKNMKRDGFQEQKVKSDP